MSYLSYRGVRKQFDEGERVALFPTSFEVEKGECIVIVGTSGSGKTTLLKVTNGLLLETGGDVYIQGRKKQDIPMIQLRQMMGYVMQEGGLFPHMTVEENMTLVLRLQKKEKRMIEEKVDALFQLIGMERKVYAHRFPRQLSGGQQQRVALARALATEPEILLMDEPFSALDQITRKRMQVELKMIQKKLHVTTLFVTHDLEEAFLLGDRIMIMNEGRLIEQGTPLYLAKESQHPFLKEFIHENYPLALFQLCIVDHFLKQGDRVDGPIVKRLDPLLATLPYLNNHLWINVMDENGEFRGVLNCAEVRSYLEVEKVGMGYG